MGTSKTTPGTAEEKEHNDNTGNLEWKGGTGTYGMLKPSQAKAENPARLNYLGGMRNPAEVVKGLPVGQALGAKIYKAWQDFVVKNKKAVKTAETYGTEQCKLDPNVVGAWRAELRRQTESRGKQPAIQQERFTYRSPLVLDIIEAWIKKSKDPDLAVAKWIMEGVPLGINVPIETHGVFPPSDKDQEAEVISDALYYR